MPVIVEDDVLIGGNCGVYEGAIIKRRAVLAAGTIVTGSTPLYDLVERRRHQARAGAAAGRARRRGGGAGRARGDGGQGARMGPVAGHAGDRQVPRREDRRAHGARAMDSVDVDLRRRRRADARAVRHRFHDRPRGRDRPAAGGGAARARLRRGGTAGRRRPLQRVRDARRAAARWCSPRTTTACRRSSPRGSRTACCSGAACATPRASWRRRWRPPSACGRRGERRVGPALRGRARSAAATAPRWPTSWRRPGVRFLINGEPTDNRLGLATRGMLRVRLVATGRAAHSSFPELGESAIDKLLDALMVVRGLELPEDPELGRTHYTVGPHRRRRGAERRVAARLGRADVPHRRRRRRRSTRRCASSKGWSSLEHILEIPAVHMHRVSAASRPPCSPTPPTCRC